MADRGDQVSGALILSQANDQLFHQSCFTLCDKCCKTSSALVGSIMFLKQGFIQLRASESLNSRKSKKWLEECKAIPGFVLPQSQGSESAGPWIWMPARSTELLLAGLWPELRPRNLIYPVAVAHPHPSPPSPPPRNGILFYKDIQPLFIKLVSDGASTISPGNFLQWLITVTVKTHTSILIWISLPSVSNHGI